MESAANLPATPEIVDDEHFDFGKRRDSLEKLRKENFRQILNRLESHKRPPSKLLDVGCAEGWFLEEARGRGYDVYGIEPDPWMARTLSEALPVRQGLFPDALSEGELFDIITFNDVFEHLPDAVAGIQACRKHLAPDGYLIINLPNSRGALYRISKMLRAVGMSEPFERMWQIQYPSPHLHYFNPDLLRRLADAHDLIERERAELPAIRIAGAWNRIRCDREAGILYCGAMWMGLMAALPSLALLPSDISVQIFQLKDTP
jgi:2-polyprenyl-3-methyl-5-hydroxy-6-metoxy-1,4-benzoquinol methylase